MRTKELREIHENPAFSEIYTAMCVSSSVYPNEDALVEAIRNGIVVYDGSSILDRNTGFRCGIGVPQDLVNQLYSEIANSPAKEGAVEIDNEVAIRNQKAQMDRDFEENASNTKTKRQARAEDKL